MTTGSRPHPTMPGARPDGVDLPAMRLQIEAVVWRGAIAESRHRFQAAVCTPEGAMVAGTEAAGMTTTFRSAAKPFQLLPLVERGHAARMGFDDETLALMAASHTGSRYHVERVAAVLARLGLSAGDLACGYHEPLDPDSAARIRMHPEERSALYNNCSGKHAGMLALALAEGWPTAGYERADHPVQQLMRRTVGEMCGLGPEEVAVGVDGCSVSVFGLPLTGMARAFARLASARASAAAPGGERERALARIRDAMLAFPRATGGTGRLSTELMERARGHLVAKGGAEGLECLGLPAAGLGIALKCEDGQSRALAPALVGVLERIEGLPAGELERLADLRTTTLRNHAGLEVGRLTAEVRVSGDGAGTAA